MSEQAFADLQKEPITFCTKSHMIHVTSCSLEKVLLLGGVERKMLQMKKDITMIALLLYQK